MKFTKMHGCGNDYVYVDGSREHIEPSFKPELVRRLSDRHTGIGGDGVIFINPSDKADFEMEMWNADGTRSEMCGNGIRCVAKYVYDHALTDKTALDIVSGGSIKHIKLFIAGLTEEAGADSGLTEMEKTISKDQAAGCDTDHTRGYVASVRVDMGAPVFDPALIPVSGFEAADMTDPKTGVSSGADSSTDDLRTPAYIPDAGVIEAFLNVTDASGSGLELSSKKEDTVFVRASCVSMGNPHAVILVDDVQKADVYGIGPAVENDPFFPKRTNVEFVHVIDRSHIDMRVWERGTGETMACGTGACASAVVCIAKGLCDSRVDVGLLGGTLTIEWDGDPDSHVCMTGPAVEVFSGEICVDVGSLTLNDKE